MSSAVVVRSQVRLSAWLSVSRPMTPSAPHCTDCAACCTSNSEVLKSPSCTVPWEVFGVIGAPGDSTHQESSTASRFSELSRS